MKKSLFFAPFIVFLVILPFLSCSSTPKAETPPAKAQPSDTPSRASQAVDPALASDLDAAAARAGESRKKAADFDSSAYFPSEWENAEAQFNKAEQTPRTNDASVRDAIASYNAAADAYDSLFKLVIPLYAQAREDEIVALRNALIAGGGRDYFPEHLTTADKIALTALDQYEAEDYYTAKDTADQALMLYQTLTSAYNAWLTRREIEEREFEGYDPDNFERAGEILSDAMDAYGAKNYALAHENANEALNRYNLVLSAGWAAHAELYAALAATARQDALDVKADVAVRYLFTEADASYKNGVNAMDKENYAVAAKQFYEAEALFVLSTSTTLEKRRIAAETIEEANRKIEESDETARLAEIILEGGAE